MAAGPPVTVQVTDHLTEAQTRLGAELTAKFEIGRLPLGAAFRSFTLAVLGWRLLFASAEVTAWGPRSLSR